MFCATVLGELLNLRSEFVAIALSLCLCEFELLSKGINLEL